jgi:hypothetical protein
MYRHTKMLDEVHSASSRTCLQFIFCIISRTFMRTKLNPSVLRKERYIDRVWKIRTEHNICVQLGELKGLWIKIHSDSFTLCTLHYIISVIKSLTTKWIYSTHEIEEKCVYIYIYIVYVCVCLVQKLERKRLLVRHRRKYENNIKMDIKLIGYEGTD